MRRILIVLLMMAVSVAHARILHVGNDMIQLSQTKVTTPALHVRVGDEVWYGNMTRCPMPMNENTDKKLHVKYNGGDYYISELEEIEDHLIVDGKLVAANCNIYLESTATQWIDTGLYGNQDSGIKIKTQTFDVYNHISGIFGSRNANGSRAFYLTGGYDDGKHWYFGYGNTKNLQTDQYVNDFEIHEIYFNKNNVYKDGVLYWQSNDTTFFTTPETMPLFRTRSIGSTVSRPLKGRIWYAMVWDNDTLVRHFVPVPCGLKIGDFVVPENGMWDIVEQKFYGNMGTGEFIYGVD